MNWLCILKAVVAWSIFTFVGTNLLGFIVRGLLWTPPSVDAPTDRVAEVIAHETQRMSGGNTVMTFLAIAVTAISLFALFYFWNILLAVSAVTIMASRIPDLIWEIRTGSKVTRQNSPQGPLYTVTPIFWWGSLPLIWYALCQ